jgi:hypothetical protein
MSCNPASQTVDLRTTLSSQARPSLVVTNPAGIQSQLDYHRQHLCSESLVTFYQVAYFQAHLAWHLANRQYRAQAHHPRFHPGRCRCYEVRQRLQAELASAVSANQPQGGSAIVQAGAFPAATIPPLRKGGLSLAKACSFLLQANHLADIKAFLSGNPELLRMPQLLWDVSILRDFHQTHGPFRSSLSAGGARDFLPIWQPFASTIQKGHRYPGRHAKAGLEDNPG